MEIKFYNELIEVVKLSNSIRGALFAIKQNYWAFSECDIGYEYFIQPNAFKRGDIITETTLPSSLTDLYKPSGGENADPIVENITAMKEFMTVDVQKIINDKASKYYKNPFFGGLLKNGCSIITAYNFLPEGEFGFGALTLMKPDTLAHADVSPLYYADFGYALHTIFKSQGYIRKYLGITDKEYEVLNFMAAGKTANDVADKLNVSQRTIELRLRAARQKLKARTTTEAVYKSVCYGVL